MDNNNENIYDVVYTSEETTDNTVEIPVEEINSRDEYNNNYESNNDEEEVDEKPAKKKKRRRAKGGLGKVVALVVACSLLGGLGGSGLTYFMLKNNTTTSNSGGSGVNYQPINFQKQDGQKLTYTEAYNKVAPAVVIVSTKGENYNGFYKQQVEGIGSGFILNEEGYILTNYHVIKGASEVVVTLSDKRDVKAKIVNYDEEQDVAMIKIVDDNVKVPATVELGDSDALNPGEEVIAIGTPLSKELSQTLTNGIVSAVNRNVETESGVKMNLIQTNTAINPGNSGGPLVNGFGQVVGINTMKMSGEAEGIGFAIPINDIKGKIEGLSKPILNLGVTLRTVDADTAKKASLEEGLYIVEVTEYSPAEKAGLKSGDLITSIDGKRVKTFDELKAAKNAKAEGDNIEIGFIRDGKSKTATLTLTTE